MNKKILLLGAAFMGIASLPSEARIGGFYAGVQGGIDLAQFKIYDGTKCDPATVTGDPTFGRIHVHTYDTGITTTTYIRPNESATAAASVTGSAFCSGSDGNIGVDTTYKVRPAGAIFLGYNYQVTPNVVVGVELVGGMTFGTHTYEGPIKLQPLTHHTASVSSGTLSTTGPSTYPTAYSDMKFEMDTKFVGDASLRIGFVLPGTDGRFAVFARGGVGFQNREIKAHLGNLDPYVLAASAAFHAAAKQDEFNANKAARTAAGAGDNHCSINAGDGTPEQKALKLGYVNKMISYLSLRAAAAGNVASKMPKNAYVVVTPEGENLASTDIVGQSEAALANQQRIALHMLDNMQGTDTLSSPGAMQMGNISKSETKFTWHVGGDLEYHFASGLFVRASYTFRYAKGFFVEGDTALKTRAKFNITKPDVAAWLQGQMFTNADGTKTAPGVTLLAAQLSTAADAILAVANSACQSVQSYTIANLKSRYGTGDKSYHHEFAVGIGFRFCG